MLFKSCLILMSCLWRQSWSFIGWDSRSPQIVKLHLKSYCYVCLKIYWLLVWCALCFMHLIIGFSLNIFLVNIFLIDWVMGYPGRSWVNLFLFRIKKNRVWIKYFLDLIGLNQKILTLMSWNHSRVYQQIYVSILSSILSQEMNPTYFYLFIASFNFLQKQKSRGRWLVCEWIKEPYPISL